MRPSSFLRARPHLQEALDLIKPVNESIDYSLLEFIFTVRRALSLANTDQQIVLQTAAQRVYSHIKIPGKRFESWMDFKSTIFVGFGINESIEQLEEKLKNVQMGSKPLEKYYKEVVRLLRDLTILEYEKREWREMFSIMLEVERKVVEAFIEGMRTVNATYLMIKKPKCLTEAYELARARMEKDQKNDKEILHELLKTIKILEVNQTSSRPVEKKPPPLCATLLIKTNRKYLFYVWQAAPGNFIKISSFPAGTLFTWAKNTIKSIFGDIETIGTIKISLYIMDQRLGPFMFYVLPETSKIEDDGIIQFKYETVTETQDGFKFTLKCRNGEMEELKMGLDCPKQGQCGHWATKIFINEDVKAEK